MLGVGSPSTSSGSLGLSTSDTQVRPESLGLGLVLDSLCSVGLGVASTLLMVSAGALLTLAVFQSRGLGGLIGAALSGFDAGVSDGGTAQMVKKSGVSEAAASTMSAILSALGTCACAFAGGGTSAEVSGVASAMSLPNCSMSGTSWGSAAIFYSKKLKCTTNFENL
jgi:hypothetical protein